MQGAGFQVPPVTVATPRPTLAVYTSPRIATIAPVLTTSAPTEPPANLNFLQILKDRCPWDETKQGQSLKYAVLSKIENFVKNGSFSKQNGNLHQKY